MEDTDTERFCKARYRNLLQLGSDCSGNSVRCIIVHCPLQLLQLLLILAVLAAMYSSN